MKRPRQHDAQSTARTAELAEFDSRLKAFTRVTPVTGALLGVNVVVWIAMVWQGADWLEPSADVLTRWGANGPLAAEGQGWRLLAACFLHQGLLQLIFNQWALYQLGTLLERLVGHIGLALIYLISGFAAGLASLLARPEAVTAGSTPAIAGLLGAIITYHFRVRGALPPGVLSRLRASVFVFLAWNIGYGVFRHQMDNAGFLGGLATGLCGGLIVALPLAEASRYRRMFRNSLLAACGAALAFLAAFAVRPSAFGGEIARYREVHERCLGIYTEASQRMANDGIRPEQFVKIIEREVLPDWEEQQQRFRDLKELPERAAPLLKTIERSMELRAQTWQLEADMLSLGEEIEHAHQTGQDAIATFAAGQDRYRLGKLTIENFLGLLEAETLPRLAEARKVGVESADVPQAFEAPLKTWQQAIDARERALRLMVQSLRVEREYQRGKQADDLPAEADAEQHAAGDEQAVQAKVDQLWRQADALDADFRAGSQRASEETLRSVAAKAKQADALEEEFLDGIDKLRGPAAAGPPAPDKE
jgi:rhomboid protease GluP